MEIKFSDATLRPNKVRIPLTFTASVEEWNELYQYVINNNYHKMELGTKGGIRTTKTKYWGKSYYVDCDNKSCTLIIIDKDGCRRIQWRNKSTNEEETKTIPTYEAWSIFLNMCEKNNVNLTNYELKLKEALEVKKTMPKAKIWCNPLIKNIELVADESHRIFHLDLNSSYPSGLAITHNEFYPIIKELYDTRKTNEVNKLIMNIAIGYMQSKYINYKYCQLAKDAINYNNSMIDDISNKMKREGLHIIAYNTDGIWYTGDHPYHDQNEGCEMGQWKTDYYDCKRIRFKSDGAYEFEDQDGNYYARQRGNSVLNRTKPRSEWKWGDIYTKEAAIEKFYFNPKVGIMQTLEVY